MFSKIILVLAVVAGTAFGQLRFSLGAFYGDITMAQTSNYVQLGQLPAGAVITAIKIGEAVKTTNTECTNSIQIGIRTQTNYFLGSTQLPLQVAPAVIYTTSLSNGFRVLSSTVATPVYGYVTRAGALAGTAYGTYRVVIEYVQK